MSHGGAWMPLTIGVDIGGTKVLAGVVDSQGQVLARTRRKTGDAPESISAAIVEAIGELSAEHEIGAVGLSAAGFISADRTHVIASPNIPAWKGTALATEIADRVLLPVILENDANCAAWGEARFGAGRGHEDVLVVTVGTGIGGGLIIGGHLVRGAFGIAAEPGHIAFVPDGLACGCGKSGCWEQYGSGTALLRVAREHGYQGASGSELTRAAEGGDVAALAAFSEIGWWLGRGIASICMLIDPAVVIVGGGVSDAGETLLAPTRVSFEEHLPAAGERPMAALEIALLGGDAGMIGAADLARDLAQ